MSDDNRFELSSRDRIWPGLEVCSVVFQHVSKKAEARFAMGRAVFLRPDACELHIYPFYELINRSKVPGIGYEPGEEANLGANIIEFVEGETREWRTIHKDVLKRCIFACNTVHTNFVRSNGFVVSSKRLIFKPPGAAGLDSTQYKPLGNAEGYSAIVVRGQILGVEKIRIKDNSLKDIDNAPDIAISGPIIIESGQPKGPGEIYWRPSPGAKEKSYMNSPGVRLPPGPTVDDEVNFDPGETKTSFTAFGVAPDGELVCVSLFEKFRNRGRGTGTGINVFEMGALLERLHCTHGILGGGGGDTQQFVKGCDPEFMIAAPRARRPGEESRKEVPGIRGLGAILVALV